MDKRKPYRYELVAEEDGDKLGLTLNHSFCYPSICIYIEDGETKSLNAIRMNCVQARELISELNKLIEEGEKHQF